MGRKIKILLVQETDWFEKGPLQQNHLMEKLSAKGHEIRVIDHEILWKSHRKEGLISKRRIYDHVSRLYPGSDITVIRPGIIRIPTLDYVSILFSRSKELVLQIREFRPDIILGFQILTPYLAVRFAKKAGIPFVYYWTDIYHAQIPFKLYQPLGKAIEKQIINKASMVVSMNEKLKKYTIALGAPSEGTVTVKGSVDISKFNLDINSQTAKLKFGFNESDFILCFVGLFHDSLALEEIVISLAKVKNDRIKLLLVGEGDQSAPNKVQELKLLAKTLGIDHRVVLTGKRPYHEVPEFMAAGDVCILPALPKEMMLHIVPIKMYEYMAMKKPVIATKLPGIVEEFGEDNGVIFVDDPKSIVTKAIEISALNVISELGLKARHFVEKNSWDSMTDKFEKTLKGLIDKVE